jgi:hypothetical protein
MHAFGRDMETGTRSGEAVNGAPASARLSADMIENAPPEVEPDLRKRLVNLDVNPGGDI